MTGIMDTKKLLLDESMNGIYGRSLATTLLKKPVSKRIKFVQSIRADYRSPSRELELSSPLTTDPSQRK